MKKIFNLLLLLAIGLRIQAQNTPPLPSGNIGIGTMSPNYSLEVSGNGHYSGPVWFSHGNQTMAGYSWVNAALVTNSIEIINNIGTVNDLSPTLAFHRYGSGGPQFRLAADGSNVLYLESANGNSARSPLAYGGGQNSFFTRLHVDGGLTTTGNVGIGTSNPGDQLTVQDRIRVSISNGSGGFYAADAANGGNSLLSLTRQGNNLGLSAWEGIGLTAGATSGPSNAYQFYIHPSGNIGINTVSPSGKLHINVLPDASLSTIRIGGSNPGNIHVPYGASTGAYNIDFHTWRDVVSDQIGARIKAERINVFAPDNALIQGMDLAFFTSDGVEQSRLTEKVRIKFDGNVGIGTGTPDAKLAVNGTMHAREVKVDLNFPAPDYVFAKTYRLRSLTSLENYINSYRHLPEVPSAKVMKRRGILQSQMNMQLLRKVEELTLYLLVKEKEVKNLQQRMSTMEKLINRSNGHRPSAVN